MIAMDARRVSRCAYAAIGSVATDRASVFSATPNVEGAAAHAEAVGDLRAQDEQRVALELVDDREAPEREQRVPADARPLDAFASGGASSSVPVTPIARRATSRIVSRVGSTSATARSSCFHLDARRWHPAAAFVFLAAARFAASFAW